ncbi:MAG: efflux transporter outer membrane subunit [Verrucomicrobiales bacterium]
MVRSIRLLAAIPAFAALVGCAALRSFRGGDAAFYKAPESPEAWMAAVPAAGDPSDWIARFGDTSLATLCGEALEANRDLRAAAARVLAARERIAEARAAMLPQLSSAFSSGRAERVGAARSEPDFALGIEASWEVDLWRRLREATTAEAEDYLASEADLAAARQALAASVARTYFSAAEAASQSQLASETVASFAEALDVVEDSFERGVASALDVRLARANIEGARAALERRRREEDSAIRALEVLAGRYPGKAIEPRKTLPSLTAAVPAGIPSELLGRRPDIRAAERRARAADRRLGEARKLLLPSLRLTGSAGGASADLGRLLDKEALVWSIVSGLTQPILEGGRLRANIRRQEALRLAAAEDYAAAALNAFQEVETALAAESYLRAQEAALRRAAEESTAAAELALDRYSRGLEQIITLLESQRRAFDAQSALISAQGLRAQNRIDLYLALGGDPSPLPQGDGRSRP